MRVLLTGASGFLGQWLLDHFAASEQHELYAAYGSLDTFEQNFASSCVKMFSVDLSDRSAVEAMINEVQPEVVVHLAAISSPASCEKEPERAMAVNVPLALLDHLSPTAVLIFLSTDQVYDGCAPPYSEDSPTQPVNVYGSSKLSFEQECLRRMPGRSVCLRSSLILGPRTRAHCRKQSFVQFCDDKLKLDAATEFIIDEYRSVIYVGDIVRIISWFASGGVVKAPGVYNMGGPERVSRMQVAEAVAIRQGYPLERIAKVKRASLPLGPAASPPDISMLSMKLTAVTGITPMSLTQMIELSLPQ